MQNELTTRASKFSALIGRLFGNGLTGESLKGKVFRGGTWLGAGTFTEQVFRFARNMILTRLLAPEAFGTMAIVLSAGSVIHAITDMGVKEGIIQNPKGMQLEYASAAWWLAFGRSLSLYVFIFLLAPSISLFYGNRELVPLLRVVSLTVIFDGGLSSHAYIAIKQMKFAKWAAIKHGGGISGVVITLALSLFIRDVWALVFGTLAESAAACMLSYILCPYLPSCSWDRNAFRDLLKFSRGLFGLSFLNLVFARTDVFVLAKLYSPAALGLYVMAIYLVQTPANFVTNLLGQVFLPTYSHIQGQPARENRIFTQVTQLIVLVGLPALVFIWFCGRSLLVLFYGPRYGSATSALIVASCVVLLSVLNAQITTIFYARGQPNLHRHCVALMAFTMALLIYPFVKWFGVVGGQLSALAAVAVGYIFQVVRLHNLTGLSVVGYGRILIKGSIVSATVSVLFFVAKLVPRLNQPIPNIVLGIAGCILAYGFHATVTLRTMKYSTSQG